MKAKIISTEVFASVSEDGKSLIISLPLQTDPKLTSNQKNFVVAKTGEGFQNWVTVDVEGETVGLTVCALVPNPAHPDNQPKPVAPPVPKFFVKKNTPSIKPSGAPSTNGKSRVMPSSVS